LNKDIVIFTTFRQGLGNNPIEKVRADVFLDTASACAELGITLVTTYKECTDEYLNELRDLGVILFDQLAVGIGAVRREALRTVLENMSGSRYYLWTEPEKPMIPSFALNAITELEKTKSNICFFNRIDMRSYPAEQAYYYLFCRKVASKLVGFDWDYAFGPMILTRESASYFLNYQSKYGDDWDSILIPRLYILRDELKYLVKPVKFKNDPRMTAIESGSSEMILKRIDQFNNVIPSLIAEWRDVTTHS